MPPQTLRLPPEASSHQLWGLEPAGRYGVQLWGRGGDTPPTPLETTFDTREPEAWVPGRRGRVLGRWGGGTQTPRSLGGGVLG